ncbi:MAG: RNA polymerase sigma factor [bacterium]|nr:RNA polymerase sigma factor [bacterium]
MGPAEFAALFEASGRLLWTIAAAVVIDRTLVDDVLQEAAMIGLAKLDQFDPATRFEAWMGRIVRWVALNHARKRSRRGTRSADAALLDDLPSAEPAGHLPDTRNWLEGEHFDDELTEALRELGSTARACLMMKIVLELDYAEIARTLEVPQGTAMSHVHRACAKLRQRLEAGRSEIVRDA